MDRIQPEVPLNSCGLAIIGEAPGADEIREGRPFVGKAGSLLNTVLERVGIERDRCLVTNVFLSRPENNKIDKFFRIIVEGDEDFITRYGLYRNRVVRHENRIDMERLDQELDRFKPSVILLLGATALWRMTKLPSITEARGNWIPAQHPLVMPTWHPSAVARSPKTKINEFVSDIKLVADLLVAQ